MATNARNAIWKAVCIEKYPIKSDVSLWANEKFSHPIENEISWQQKNTKYNY